MITIKTVASLKNRFGEKKEIKYTPKNEKFQEIARRILEYIPEAREFLHENGHPKPGYIIFVNGTDARLIDTREFSGDIEITVIPITHGGELKIRNLTWSEIDDAVEKISQTIVKRGEKYDTIVAIMRGGLIPARLLADKLDIRDIGVIEIKFYIAPGETRTKPIVRQPLTLDIEDKKVLIVDDVSDTGKSLQVALTAISLHGPSLIHTATLYLKPWSTFVPDYFAYTVEEWIVFPWETNEVKKELAGRYEP
ncbi:MAG: hypothetical protein F7C32_00200 [Desulfurococcales archaeon]|nr:hypothetical protein [Desulfurococcales archaeon]